MAENEGALSNETSSTDTGSEELSPSIETDTQQDAGSDADRGTDDEAAALRAENEELKKRVAHGSRTVAENRRLQEEIQNYNARLQRWKAANVDPEEIDRAIAAAQGGTAPQPNQQPQLTLAQIEQQVEMKLYQRDAYEAMDRYFEKDSDLDTKSSRTFFEAMGRNLAQQEIDEYGRVVSTPKQLVSAVAKIYEKEILAVAEKRAGKRMSETREKVKGQGITDSPHVKTKLDREEGNAPAPGTREHYNAVMDRQRAAFDNTKRRA